MALSANELFSLKWGEFQSFISNSVRSLREVGDFTDVTLVCEDGGLEAHRVILSACSPFFQRVLKLSGKRQPMIFMRGVESRQLTSLLDFIYTGETELARDDVDQFMLLASQLKIKGLVSDEVFNKQTDTTVKAQDACREEENEPTCKEAGEDPIPMAKKLKIKGLASGKAFIEPSIVVPSLENNVDEEEITLDESTAGYKVMEVESETIAFEEKVRVKKDTSHFKKEIVTDASELDEKIETMMEKGERGFVCKMCENYAGTRQHVIYHIEANHVEGLKHLCTECNRYYKVRHSLKSHIKRKHKQGTILLTPDMNSLGSLNCLKEEWM